MNEQKPLAERIIWLIKNNHVLAFIIVFGSIVIAVGTFTDATNKIINFIMSENPEDARGKLIRMGLSYEPSVFLECIENNDLTAAQLFLSAEIDPNTAWPDDTTALMVASKYCQKPVLVALLNKGGRP